MSWLWIGLAWATDTALYRQQASLELEGPALVELGEASMLPNSHDVVLLDAEGLEQPWVMLDSDQPSPRRWKELPMRAEWTDHPHMAGVRIDTRAFGRKVDLIEVKVAGLWDLDSWPRDGSAWALALEVRDESGRLVAEGLLWRAHIAGQDRANDLVEVPELPPGVYTITSPRRHVRWRSVRVSGGADLDVPELELELPVQGPEPAGQGRSRYVVELPAAGVELRELELEVADERFLRSVRVSSPSFDGGDALRSGRMGQGKVERLQLNGTDIEHLLVELDGVAGDRLEILVEDGRDRPLELEGVVVRALGRRLLVHEAGPSPQTLYVGPLEPQPGSHDLDHALVELLESELERLPPPAWRANPAHDPRSGLPASLLQAAPLERKEAIQAELTIPAVGHPTRWVLTPEVVSASTVSMQELRIVDGQGRQVPFLRDAGGLRQLEVEVERSEVGSNTLLTLTSPQTQLLQAVVLESSDPAFARQARVELHGGTSFVREPGEPEPRIQIPVARASKEGQVLVWIDNQDDLPLQDLRVELWGHAPALVAIAPEEASLVLGEQLSTPSYDLSRFGSRLLQGPVEAGSVGPVLREERLIQAPDQKLWTGLGVGGLALGLVGLAWRLVGGSAPMASTEDEE